VKLLRRTTKRKLNTAAATTTTTIREKTKQSKAKKDLKDKLEKEREI